MAVQERHRFLTEGVQLAFNLADPIEQVGTAGEPLTPHRSYIFGPMTTPKRIRTLGPMKVLGVCFRSARAYPFISHPAGESANRCIRTGDILDSEALQIVERMLKDCLTTDERVKILDLHFLHRFEKGVSKDFSTAVVADRIETNRK